MSIVFNLLFISSLVFIISFPLLTGWVLFACFGTVLRHLLQAGGVQSALCGGETPHSRDLGADGGQAIWRNEERLSGRGWKHEFATYKLGHLISLIFK